MAFIRQLRLLLWKNGLGALRNPLWALTLIVWPVLIFAILAATRIRFPPVIRDTCYVGPRNLPSTGFFPFLQTLMCNTDSICYNKSVASSSSSGQWKTSRSHKSSAASPLTKIFASNIEIPYKKQSYKEVVAILDTMKNIIGSSEQRRADQISAMRGNNSAVLGDQYDRKMMVETANQLKMAVCTPALNTMNTTSTNHLTQGMILYCRTNATLAETVIAVVNKMLSEKMLTKPEEILALAGATLSVLSELQNHTSLWEGLLGITNLTDEANTLHTLEALAIGLQSTLHALERNVPGSQETLSAFHPILTVGINVINYVKNWPGHELHVNVADVLRDDGTMTDMVKMFLQCGKIPLDQAIVLAFDKTLVCSYLCNNTNFMGSTLCKIGAVDKVIDMISDEKLAKQVLNVWSKHSAESDIEFFMGQVHSLMGGQALGGNRGSKVRARRSAETQSLSIDEELFLNVGKVVLRVLKMVPDANMVVKNILKIGYWTMNTATSGLNFAKGMLQGGWVDAEQLDVIGEVMDVFLKVLMDKPVTCEDVMAPLEDLLAAHNMTMEFKLICQDPSNVLHFLLEDWEHVLALINNITMEEDDDTGVSLPMILSAWHKLYAGASETVWFLSNLVTELSGNESMSWIPGSDATMADTLHHSVLQLMVSSGQNLEQSDQWPMVKDYFHMADLVLKYEPGETTHPPNCSLDLETMAVHCNSHLNWHTFSGGISRVLMSPSPDTLLSLLKGTVVLLQNIFGDTLSHLAAQKLPRQIPGGKLFSDFLLDLMENVHDLVSYIAMSTNQNTANPHVMMNVTKEKLQSSGLALFFPLFSGERPPSFSDVLEATAKFGRLNQRIFDFDEADTAVKMELERLMTMFLSLEGNLGLSVSHMMGTYLVKYGFHLYPNAVEHLIEAPLTNQTTVAILETILKAIESMRTVIDSKDDNPTQVVLHYIRQLECIMMNLIKLRQIEKAPNGSMSETELNSLLNISQYLTPMGMQMLSQARPDDSQKIILDLLHKVLPKVIQQRIPPLIQDFTELQYQLTSCEDVTRCSVGIMKIFTHLEQVLNMVLSSNITLKITGPDLSSGEEGFQDMAEHLFSLCLTPEDPISVETFKKVLHAVKMINATSNVSLSEIQHVLQQLNLTMEELEYLTSVLGDVKVNDLIERVMQTPNVLMCFEEDEDPDMMRKCVVEMMAQYATFLLKLPALSDHKAVVLSIPSTINQTLLQLLHMNPITQTSLVRTLHKILNNIKTNLQLSNMYTPDVKREFEMLENLMKVAGDPKPLHHILNITSTPDVVDAMEQWLEVIQWYLMKLEKATASSSTAELLHPTLSIIQMNVAQQLAQSRFSIFVSNKIEHLRESLEYPLDDEGVHKIGQTAFAIVQGLFNFINVSLQNQDEFYQTNWAEPLLNSTAEIEHFLHGMRYWLQNPNVTMTLAQMFQWDNSSNPSMPLMDINHLLQTMDLFLTSEDSVVLHHILNIIENLNRAIMIADNLGDQEMDQLSAPIMEALKNAFHLLPAVDLPQQKIMEIVQHSLKLFLLPNMSFPESVNTWMHILTKGEELVEETLPEHLAVYPKALIIVAKTYFKGIKENTGPDTINMLILDEMMAVKRLLPPHSAAQEVVSGLIKVYDSVLQPQKGNKCPWEQLRNLTSLNVTAIFEHVDDVMKMLWPLLGFNTTIPLQLSDLPHQEVMEIVQHSLKLFLLPNMTFPESVNTWIHILTKGEELVEETLPEHLAVYPKALIVVAKTYFKGIKKNTGPDTINMLILDEMMAVKRLLPPHCAAQEVVSGLIKILHFVLQPQKGNKCPWEHFRNLTSDNMTAIFEHMDDFMEMLWPHLGFNTALPLQLSDLSEFIPIIEQMLKGEVDHETWEELEDVLEVLLSTFLQPEHWHNASFVVHQFRKVAERLLKNMQAENDMIQSLQMPVMMLIKEVAHSLNSSHLMFSDFSGKMRKAIEQTLEAAQQTNRTLECSEAVKIWEPVGLNHSGLAMWCETYLQNVLEAYEESDTVYSGLGMKNMDEKPMTAGRMASTIVNGLHSLYQVNMNRSALSERFIAAVSFELSTLMGKPMSPSAQRHLYEQLQEMLPQESLFAVEMIFAELVSMAPMYEPHFKAVQKALDHILKNGQLMQNGSLSEDLLEEAVMILLHSANITAEDLMPLWDKLQANHTDSYMQIIRTVMKLMMDLGLFKDVPMGEKQIHKFLGSATTKRMIKNALEMVSWWMTTEDFGLDLLMDAVPKMFDIIKQFFSALSEMGMDVPCLEMYSPLIKNTVAVLRQLIRTSSLLDMMEQSMHPQQEAASTDVQQFWRQHKEPPKYPRVPMDDFIDLFSINYKHLFEALSVPPTTGEMIETVHKFFAHPDLTIVMNGLLREVSWDMSPPTEMTINASIGVISYLTSSDMTEVSFLHPLLKAMEMLPDELPFAPSLRYVAALLASEAHEIQAIMKTIMEFLEMGMADPNPSQIWDKITAQVCMLEKKESVQDVMSSLSLEPGLVCEVVLPVLQMMIKIRSINTSELMEALFETVIGDPATYKVEANWTSVISQSMGFNHSNFFGFNATSQTTISVGGLMKNESAFIDDINKYIDLPPAALRVLTTTKLPRNNVQILGWLVNLRHCPAGEDLKMEEKDRALFTCFCNMNVGEWYSFTMVMAHHVDLEKFVYRMVLSEDMQNMVTVMLKVVDMIVKMMDEIMPSVNELHSYLISLKDLNLGPQFHQMSRRERRDISAQATFVTLSRALCRHGIVALMGISKLPMSSHSQWLSSQEKEELIDRFKIPRNATPYCTNMYLEMVGTTGGAIAWAFLKPMLMGEILYTPDTPVTRAIMQKSNSTLHEFANLRKYSEEWIESSNYILKSAKLLSQTLPLLQNSLGNRFVKNFIEMQTDIDVGRMKETLNSFSNLTKMLEENKEMVNQVTALSTLMVNISSCITFDRYRGYDSEEQLDAKAQELAKDRRLFGSVIFKLPKNGDSSATLPPKVPYTIRMHMDNVMRTDRTRRPFYSKERHLTSSMSYRYNRGFVYLQENIERAIIETHTGQRVTDPAVQIQPFPYPCHFRDEYLEAISFVFPLMLMIAWILFVADFVRKLVYEKELRLHEYMKMMGVNPLSHFFAWFLECAAYLVFTIIILTLVLKHSGILSNSDGFLLFLFLCDYGLSIVAFSYLVSSFFDRNYIAGLSGSLLYILAFFPYIVVMALEGKLTFSQKSLMSIFSPTCFSYASQYMTRFEAQGDGIQWSNSYTSPIAGDDSSFGWLCWLMLIDSVLYFTIGAYIRAVFPGAYGIPAPWYFPFQKSFWTGMFCSSPSQKKGSSGLLFFNIMQENHSVLSDTKGKGQSSLSTQEGGDFSHLPVGVTLHGLTKAYGDRVALENLNLTFYEGHVTSLLGHNGAGKTTTMSLLTGLFAPSAGSIQVYGKDMQSNLDEVRQDLGVCMQYDVLFSHMTTKEHLLLYGQIKAPQWSKRELREQVRTILEETGMYAHRHKKVGTLSGGMKRKLSISIAFIGGSRLVVLDEPTTGVDPCSRRSIWEIVIQHKKNRTIIMSSHHLDEAEILSDRIAFLERGGLKCCGTPYYLKDKLGHGYKLTLTKKVQSFESQSFDSAEIKSFIQAHVPEAHLVESQGGDLVYSLPPFTSANSSSYRSLLTALDANLDSLHLGGYGISDTTLEEVFLQLTEGTADLTSEDTLLTVSESMSDTGSINSFPEELSGNFSSYNAKLTGSSTESGLYLAWQQMSAMIIKRIHHSRRDLKGLLTQVLLPILFVVFAMGLATIKSDLRHYPEMELSPALYNIGPSYTFFRNQDPNSTRLVDTMMSYPGIDNACLSKTSNPSCTQASSAWTSSGSGAKTYRECKCARGEQVCDNDNFVPPHTKLPSSQVAYNVTGFDVEKYLVGTTNDYIRNRYGGFDFGMSLPPDLQMDLRGVPANRTLSKVWFNPEGHHTMPAYLNSLNNLILRANLPADKDPREYAISVSSHPYFGRPDDEDAIVQGMLRIMVVMCVLTGYALTTASFAIYEVNEHHTGAKRLQHIAGISEPFYWAVNFLYDMFIYMIPVVLTVAVFAAFQVPAFTDRQNLAAITLLLVLFGFATFPWMYLVSGLFKGSEMAFITYVCINLFITINTIMPTSIVYFLAELSKKNTEDIMEIFNKLCNAFLIFPQFSFGNGLMHLARMNIQVQILSGYGIDAYQSPFSSDTFRWMFISLFIQGLFFFTLRLLVNKSLIRKVRRLVVRKRPLASTDHEEEDEDVTAERMRVASGAADSDILQVNQLSKVYQHFNKKKVHAVKKLSVGIPAGECFGLLGENGAGKTTTFKMLTGDVSPTDGTAQIKDQDGRLVDIMECRDRGINIGYCPQVDALDSLLTGEEHLYFYARIRGISKRNIDGVVNYLLKRLGLNSYRSIITDGYSCGTRRKLSTAMALVGHPQILLLDEPSSGMDPRTKRHLWKVISEEVKGKSAVVLTSHSMEECEALCSRLAIMVKGQFRCLGSLQHIKNRFGSGFTVKMYLAEAPGDVEAITGFMQRRFPSTYLKDQHSSMVEYHVPVAPGGVADIFDQLESNKNALQIKHFSVSQTTLDEVFINFATGNIGMDTIDEENESDLGAVKSIDMLK
ncbi:glucosylceramide transporter ABCA12 [Synchiropus splendidus]|uniref:glucosylceramide transporter ABCA12 n=1 Tax=Synchiropus splendidus TaxID=270530 RepID=UPI00237DB64F|nr:glucosylceramide transporter ABCA12 [Synchiropus splendidus]